MPERQHGAVQPGINWGPFTLRIPFVHMRATGPEALQGLVVASATGLAVVPLYAEHFAMAFETAVALVVVQSMMVYSGFLVFGDPYAPGWLTPALPLVLRETLLFASTPERIEFVNAVVLSVAAVFLLFGATGLGPWFLRLVPRVLKASIILGAGMAAIYGEFIPRSGGRASRIDAYTVCIFAAAGLTLLLLFSAPLEKWKKRWPWLAMIASLGIAPGFFLAMAVGPFVGEISYEGFLNYAGPIFFMPDFGGLIANFSVLGQGLPSAGMFVQALPLALAAYVIGFGDIITATAVLSDATKDRPDETVEFNAQRTHLQIGLRNAGVAVFGGPFFPLQGPLWTGAMVVIAERYRRGRDQMDSLWDGLVSYYFFGLPIMYFIGPMLELLRPVLDVAFSLTLILTGFACAYVAQAMLKNRLERGVGLIVAMTIMYFSTLTGLAVGFALTGALLGRAAWNEPGAGGGALKSYSD